MNEVEGIEVDVTGEVWHWRGPSPFHFVTVPDEESALLREISSAVSYGWGMIPVRARIGATDWETSLFPKDGRYVVPVKDAVRRDEGIEEGATVTVRMSVAVRR